MQWDCKRQGCFNQKKRPKIELFADCLPGRIAFSDVDAMVEIGGNLLFLEWKSHTDIPMGQRILFHRLTEFSPASVLIVEGNAETMEVESIRIVKAGEFGEVFPADIEILKNLIQQWSDWARNHPVIFGEPGCGKSFLAIDWACRVATGTPWRGHEVTPGPVVYVAGEGQQGLGRRLGAWKRLNDVSLDEKPLYIAPAVAMTDTPQTVKLLEAINKEVGRPSLVVLDTLARNFGGGDENSTQDMSRFVAACDTIRNTYKCTLLVVHHSGHSDKRRARGAIALKAALDAEYQLMKKDNQLTLTSTKMKDAEIPPSLAMELVSVELPGLVDDYGSPVTSAALDVIDADVEAIMSQAKAMPRRGKWQKAGLDIAKTLMDAKGVVNEQSWHDQCDAIGMPRTTRYRILESLQSESSIVFEGGDIDPI